MIEHVCRSCGRSFARYNTLQRLCPVCQFNNQVPKPRKPLKVMGKQAKAWTATRREWIKNNPPNHSGYWECFLKVAPGCQRFMTVDTLTLDHTQARSRHPELRNDETNLKPACLTCNVFKGSKSLEEL